MLELFIQNLSNDKLAIKERTISMTPLSLRLAQFTTKEAKGKVRDIGGWVIHEEMKACTSYISQHKCSKSPKVVKALAERRKMKAILQQMKGCKDDGMETSKCPELLQHNCFV